MNTAEAKALWLIAAEIWPTYRLPDAETANARTEVWIALLGEFDAQLVRAAILSFAEREFCPPPGMIRNRIQDLIAQASGAERVPSVDEALVEIHYAIAKYGYTRSPSFSHVAIENAVQAYGGWVRLCESPDNGTTWAQVRECYKSVVQRLQRESYQAATAIAALAVEGTTRQKELPSV